MLASYDFGGEQPAISFHRLGVLLSGSRMSDGLCCGLHCGT